MKLGKRIQSYGSWLYPFELGGVSTFGPDIPEDLNHIRRISRRRKLFFDPMIKSGFLKGKRILDLGCFSGYWSLMSLLEGEAAFVQCVDALPKAVEQAEFVFQSYQIEKTKYNICLADAYKVLETQRDKYDVILCLGFFVQRQSNRISVSTFVLIVMFNRAVSFLEI